MHTMAMGAHRAVPLDCQVAPVPSCREDAVGAREQRRQCCSCESEVLMCCTGKFFVNCCLASASSVTAGATQDRGVTGGVTNGERSMANASCKGPQQRNQDYKVHGGQVAALDT